MFLHWFSVIAPSKPRVILTHAEDDQRAALAKLIQQQFRLPCRPWAKSSNSSVNWNRRPPPQELIRRSSLWIIPVATGLAEWVFRFIVEALEPHLGWLSFGLGS